MVKFNDILFFMKPKLLLAITLCCLIGSCICKIQAQNLILKFNDGTEKSTALKSLNKITFVGTNMILTYAAGTTDSFIESVIKKMVFNVVSGIVGVSGDETAFSVYPNPVSDVLSLRNVAEGKTFAKVYRFDGALVIVKQITSIDPQIDVSSLTKGFYVLKVHNQALKFIKL